MTDKSEPRKKPAQAEDSVLGSLPSTRPARIGRRPATTSRASAAEPRREPVPEPEPAAEPPRTSGPPSGTELVTTAIQAVGELAQIGLTLGGQTLRRAARRIPRP